MQEQNIDNAVEAWELYWDKDPPLVSFTFPERATNYTCLGNTLQSTFIQLEKGCGLITTFLTINAMQRVAQQLIQLVAMSRMHGAVI